MSEPQLFVLGRRQRIKERFRSEVITLRLSKSERERTLEAAAANRQTVSQFVRDALLIAADDCLESAGDDFS